MLEVRRRHVVVDVPWIRMIRQVENGEAYAELVIARAWQKREVKILRHPQVNRKKGRKPETIRDANVILVDVDRRVRQSVVHVKDGTYTPVTRQFEISPGDKAVWHVRRQRAEQIGHDNRSLK